MADRPAAGPSKIRYFGGLDPEDYSTGLAARKVVETSVVLRNDFFGSQGPESARLGPLGRAGLRRRLGGEKIVLQTAMEAC